jgi:GNAT superfamily N-acetyltransferase
MWRRAAESDDAAIVERCLALYAEDPGPAPVEEAQIVRTLEVLRREPARGYALVLVLDDRVAGYALVITLWSNEAGGELRTIDELYVDHPHRGRGHASGLIEALARDLGDAVGLQLEVTDGNHRALTLYERLGFQRGNRLLRRMT